MRASIFSATRAWDHLREWCSCWLVWRSIHNWDENNFVYMDSDYLANNHKWCPYFGDAIDTQGIVGDVIVIRHSTNGGAVNIWYSTSLREVWSDLRRRRDWYSTTVLWAGVLVGSTWYSTNYRRQGTSIERIHLILKETSETRSISDTQ